MHPNPHSAPANPSTPRAPSAPRILPTREGYDLWASIYDSEGNPLLELEERYLWPALGDVKGLDVIDIGCGTGRHSVRLASLGANVTGLDFSKGMLAAAARKPGAEHVRFVVADLSGPLPFADRSFDRVLCCMVLDHIADLAGLFGQMQRVCRERGGIYITVMHPAMMLKGVQARFTDPATGEETRPQSVPNRISDYVTAAIGAGLRIESMREHDADEALAQRAPRAAKHLGWPLLLTMTLRP